MQTRCFDRDDARLCVHLAGRGPLAVLIHGYPLDHRMWLDTLRGPLATQRTLAAVDLRGHGCSPNRGDAVHTMDLFAADTAAVIRSLADGPVDVVGLSMGGYVALALWANHRQLVRSLTLVDTRAAADSEAGRVGRDAVIRTVLEQGRTAITSAMLPKLLAPKDPADAAHQLVRARLATMIESLPVETIVADQRGLRDRPDRSALLPGIAAPVLVVVGEHDAITPPAEARAMANAIPGARCVVVPGCGHMTPMEDPAAFAHELGAFWGAPA